MKKFLVLPILVLFLAAFLQTAFAASPQYHEFRSEAGGFSVETPVTFQAVAFADKAEPHRSLCHMFWRDLGDRAYAVEYFDYLRGVQQLDPQKVLDMALEGALAMAKSKVPSSKLLSEKPISFDGYAGREVVTEATLARGQKIRCKIHMFLVNSRLYMLMVSGNQGEITDSEMDKFLDSFRLLSR